MPLEALEYARAIAWHDGGYAILAPNADGKFVMHAHVGTEEDANRLARKLNHRFTLYYKGTRRDDHTT